MLSPRLQTLIDRLSNPDTITRVRLVRETKAVYEAEYPEAARGKAQAAGANRARAAKSSDVTPGSGVTPFAEWLAEQLGVGVTTVRTLITRAQWVPEEALKEIERRDDVTGVGDLLNTLATLMRRDPAADWRIAVEGHVNPPADFASKQWLYTADGVTFMHTDAEQRLDEMVRKGLKLAAIISDPPYGIKYKTKRGQRVAGDEKAPLWSIGPMKQLLAPGGHLVLWAGAKTLYEWTTALSAAGFSLVVIPWDKINPTMRGRECVIVAREDARPVKPTFRIQHPIVTGELQDIHATPKPVEVMVPLIEEYTKPGQYILDPFAGTAPIGVAALRLGRGYIGAEISRSIAEFAAARLRHEWRETRDVRAALPIRQPMLAL